MIIDSCFNFGPVLMKMISTEFVIQWLYHYQIIVGSHEVLYKLYIYTKTLEIQQALSLNIKTKKNPALFLKKSSVVKKNHLHKAVEPTPMKHMIGDQGIGGDKFTLFRLWGNCQNRTAKKRKRRCMFNIKEISL